MKSDAKRGVARHASIGGGIVASILASSCCIGPLIAAGLGIGSAGAFATTMSAYRPYLLGVTVLMLGVGFHLTYRTRRPVRIEGDACGCEKPRTSRAGRVGLWVATALVVVFASAPTLLAKVQHSKSFPIPTGTAVEEATIHVDGMDCEGCATHIGGALATVGGFHRLKLDLPGHSIKVTYEPAPGRLEKYVTAINDLGYEAATPSSPGVTRARQ